MSGGVPVKRRRGRSAGVRFGLVYAGLFGISIIAIAFLLWWSTAGLLNRETDAAINADTVGLAEQYSQNGLTGLEDTIEQRLAANVDDDAIYLLVDLQMQPLAGNLGHWPATVALDAEWAEIPIDHAGMRGRARLHQWILSDGDRLLIGRDVRIRQQMVHLLGGALLWGAGGALLLGVGGALAVRSLLRRALARVSNTAAAISAGDLSRRIAIGGRGDEFDQLSETINDMLDRIARLMDGVRQVSNAIAHDLRTPIARARARLEDAARSHAGAEPADAPALQAAIERAVGDLDGVVSVFQALLRISEIEAGARRSAFAPVDLTGLLIDLIELYGAAAEEGGQVLTLAMPDTVPSLWGDRDLIQQAVANLLDNALKFSPPEGRVRVMVEVDAAMIEVIVADDGPGIPLGERGRAPQRFYRGEGARSTPGSGLGLALVQAVAVLHGGSLRLGDNRLGDAGFSENRVEMGPGLRVTLSLSRAMPDGAGDRALPRMAAESPESHDGAMAEHVT